MTKWFNYFVTNKFSRLTNGHIESDKLLNKILEHNGEEAYACYFDLDYDSLKMELDTGRIDSKGKKIYEYVSQDAKEMGIEGPITFTSYEGTCKPAFNCVAFDFDGTNDNDALEDVRRFLQYFNIDDAVVFFSGSKGFHVLLHFDYFNLSAGPDLVLQLKDLAKYLEKHFPTLDSGIYNYNRKFRVPFTKHDNTGLYKSLIDTTRKKWDEEYRLDAQGRHVEDFLPPNKQREFNQQLSEAIEASKRASYEIEKHRAGTVDKPSKFEAYDGKVCIKKLLESRCDSVGRNNACLRIVNDFYRTGMTQTIAEERINKWAYECGLPEREWRIVVNDIYSQRKVYNFGCQDEIKAEFCSAKCNIWKKLAPEKRPTVIDAPKNAAVETEKAKRISQKEVVSTLLMDFFKCKYSRTQMVFHSGNVIRQEDDLFMYEDDYWQGFGVDGINKTKREIEKILGDKCTISQVENVYKMFLIHVPMVPKGVDMYLPKNNIVNFKNGTLRVVRNFDGKLLRQFKEGHSRVDYLTSKHSLDYRRVVHTDDSSPVLVGVLRDLFKGESDIEDRIKSIAMMYGAALMPMFPMMYYFYGDAKTGKSTLILILKHLLDEANLCSVQPKEFKGFNLESMVGKLVNYVTDVDIRTPINDDMVKQILDKVPMTIRRKNRTDIKACLPSVHLFAGNGLLKSFEASTAMERRWTIIEFKNVIDDSGSYFANAEDFAKHVYGSDPNGVLQFALWGLELLIESNGKFIQFESSKAAMQEWQKREDIVEQFIEDVTTDGVDLDGESHLWELKDSGRVDRPYAWKIFNVWQEDSLTHKDKIKKKDFLVRMEQKKHPIVTVRGVRKIAGFHKCDGSNVDNSNAMDQI